MNVLVSLDVKLVNLKAIKTRANREEEGEGEEKRVKSHQHSSIYTNKHVLNALLLTHNNDPVEYYIS